MRQKTMTKNGWNSFTMVLFFLLPISQGVDTISKGGSLKDGDFLVSNEKIFDLGFFSPENSTNRYVGIKYHEGQNQPIVWVANRHRPISDRNGFLTIGEDGNLQIFDGQSVLVWSSNASIPSPFETSALLEDTGNLILSRKEISGIIYPAFWQSFSFPTDTYLPNMKVLIKGENHAFTSWKSPSDPSPGRFSAGVDARGSPQIVIWEESTRIWRSGHWDGQVFSGLPIMTSSTTYQFGFKVSFEDGNSYLTYNPFNATDLTSWHISYDGFEEQLKWNETHSNWTKLICEPGDECDLYNYCGNFGICDSDKHPKCSCPNGFRPRDKEQWHRGNFSGGCERSTPLKCQRNVSSPQGQDEAEDGFVGMKGLKLPDYVDSVDVSASLEACRVMCLSNCSCNAYAKVAGIGCMIWNGDLADLLQLDITGSTMYLRLPASELSMKRLTPLVIVAHVAAGVIFLSIVFWIVRALTKRYTASKSRKSDKSISAKDFSTELPGQAEYLIEGNSVSGRELTLFNFVTIAAATNNFSEENRLGQGGFGHVYRGKLPGGQEVAVKRLSSISGQGLEEFKNEVILIAKLQHRNLVRLLGCCIEGEEKILIYEFMPNRSLDSFIFDPVKQALLDWKKRFAIIRGIARGLVYLHRDSRLRVIHRDLKASNILLDEEMNPKISDFGMARIFGGNQNEANTNRVVGTFGYMSPEYAMRGLFSVKSDVYSFGVLLLEIVSGRKNSRFQSIDQKNLITYAWELWSKQKAMEIVDPSIKDSCEGNEVLRCIQVGMLCVQDSAGHRPSMDSVVVMLETENMSLPFPKKPTFTSMKTPIDAEAAEVQDTASSNHLTVTMLEGR